MRTHSGFHFKLSSFAGTSKPSGLIAGDKPGQGHLPISLCSLIIRLSSQCTPQADMDHILFSELECKRVPNSKALRRHVEKRLASWIITQGIPLYPKGVAFHVTMEREHEGHTIGCQVTVASETEWWSAFSWGKTPEVALTQALIKMKKVASTPSQWRSKNHSQKALEWNSSPPEDDEGARDHG